MDEDMGGDLACWLHQVCEACGAFVDRDEQHQCPAPSTPGPADGVTGTVEPEPTPS
jgi:hypothetical protein